MFFRYDPFMFDFNCFIIYSVYLMIGNTRLINIYEFESKFQKFLLIDFSNMFEKGGLN